MTQDDLKHRAARAALEHLPFDGVVGVGTGSTVNHFIDLLATVKHKIDGAVSSSDASTERLRAHGIPVLDANAIGALPVYVDGADEATRHLHLVKGGGGALTREKILAASAERFVCIADRSKLVNVLGAFPVPVEVIPMARGLVARELVKRGANPVYREGFVTDNGNIILDVHNLTVLDPAAVERDLNDVPGVVTVGLFAIRPADLLLLATEQGVQTLR